MPSHTCSKALETYRSIQCEVGTMKTTLSELKHKLEAASKLSSTLISELTSKSCQLERLKALLGHGSSVLSAMQMVSEQERLLAENEDDDEELLAVFVDRRSSRLELMLHRAREQVLAAEEEEREAKLAMDRAKEQVGRVQREQITYVYVSRGPLGTLGWEGRWPWWDMGVLGTSPWSPRGFGMGRTVGLWWPQ